MRFFIENCGRRISLTGLRARGRYALVDAKDFYALRAASDNWGMSGVGSHQYPAARIGGKPQYLHRVICGLAPGDHREVDHANGDRTDNRRKNLRVCSRSENNCNRSTSLDKPKGAYNVADGRELKKPWRVMIKKNSRNHHVGYFATEGEASAAYDRAALLYHKEFAFLNNKEVCDG